jgi:hypothetical protein
MIRRARRIEFSLFDHDGLLLVGLLILLVFNIGLILVAQRYTPENDEMRAFWYGIVGNSIALILSDVIFIYIRNMPPSFRALLFLLLPRIEPNAPPSRRQRRRRRPWPCRLSSWHGGGHL